MSNLTHTIRQQIAMNKCEDVSEEFRAYLIEIERAFLEAYCCSYLHDISPQVSPDLEVARAAFDEGMDATRFVMEVAGEYGFIAPGERDYSREQVRLYNTAVAAIAEFVASDAQWEHRRNGTFCLSTDDGFALMRPVVDRRSSHVGFGIEERVGGSLSEDGYSVAEFGEPGEVIAFLDIKETLEAFQGHLARKSAPSLAR